jgi:hypothetical protein
MKLQLRQASVEISEELSNPLFWGNFAILYLASEENEYPYRTFLGLTDSEVNGYYTDFLEPLIESPTWPIFKLPIDDDRYAEIEWAGELGEYQTRLWIGSHRLGRRALLGYDSGHFSLPALRRDEFVWLLGKLERGGAHPASGLLLAPMCYLPAEDALVAKKIADLCSRLPGAKGSRAADAADALMRRMIVPEARWERKPSLGWCSGWTYSQRNPRSLLSVLTETDFAFIDQFFNEPSDSSMTGSSTSRVG